MSNIFDTNMNAANAAFALVTSETFTVIRGESCIPGECTATSIDTISVSDRMIKGGIGADGSVIIHIERAVREARRITDGVVVRVRGDDFRVKSVTKDGDTLDSMTCGPITPLSL